MKKRTLIKSIGLLGLSNATFPSSWTKPIISSILLPAHAMTSNCSESDIVGEWTFAFGDPADDLVPITFVSDGTGRLLDASPVTWSFVMDRLIVNVPRIGSDSIYDGTVSADCSTITGENLRNNDPFTAIRSDIGF